MISKFAPLGPFAPISPESEAIVQLAAGAFITPDLYAARYLMAAFEQIDRNRAPSTNRRARAGNIGEAA